jgi:hypothetical protein
MTRAARASLVAVALAAAVGAAPAAAHIGGSNGYAVITLGLEGVRYSLTLGLVRQ